MKKSKPDEHLIVAIILGEGGQTKELIFGMTKQDSLRPSNDPNWYLGFTPDTSEKEARARFARKYGEAAAKQARCFIELGLRLVGPVERKE